MVPSMEENNIAANFSDLIDKITIYYNKSNILDFLTPQSFTIVEHSVHELEDRFRSILRDFEQLQRQSNKSSANIDSVDETLSNLLTNGKEIQRDIHQRVEEIGATALNAQNAIAAFGVLKERTSEVEQMLAISKIFRCGRGFWLSMRRLKRRTQEISAMGSGLLQMKCARLPPKPEILPNR